MALDPVERPLTAGRWVPFTHTITVEGIDLTDASFAMQVRDDWNGGQIRADLTTVGTASAEGVRLVSVETVDGLPISTIGIRINESTMAAIPLDNADPAGARRCVYDLQVERTANMPEVFMRGAFIVQEGSTQ